MGMAMCMQISLPCSASYEVRIARYISSRDYQSVRERMSSKRLHIYAGRWIIPATFHASQEKLAISSEGRTSFEHGSTRVSGM